MSNDDRLEVLVQDGYFPTEAPQAYVINSAKQLTSLYSKINRTRKPGLPIPDVDFSNQLVLVACLGEVSTTALPTMVIQSETPDEIVVSIGLQRENSPLAVPSFPFCLYALKNDGKSVSIKMP